MTMKELKEKIEAFQKALSTNAVTCDNKVFAECMKDSLIALQAEFIRGLEARVEIVKREHADIKESFEELGGHVCDTCNAPMFESEGHGCWDGETICESCYESALNNR